MLTATAYPVGIVENTNASGVIFTVLKSDHNPDPLPDQPVTIVHVLPDHHAAARFRGFITEISDNVGAMLITHSEKDDHWPSHIDPLSQGNPVYAALPQTFIADSARRANAEEFQLLRQLAQEHQEATGIDPTAGIYPLN